MSKRRGRGEGAVYQRSDGKWAAAVDLGWQKNGKRQRRVLYGKTRADVARKLREVQGRVERGLPLPDERGTVASFLDRWATTLDESVKPSTIESYRDVIRLYLTPTIGKKRLARLTPADVAAMLDELERRGLSPRTRRYARAVLRRALHRAEQWGEVSRNAAALADGPRVPAREGRTLTPAEARQLLEAARGTRLEAFVAVALSCGLRRGEALGLAWSDIDLDEGCLTVRHTLQRIGGALVLGEPKTRGSRRRVELPASCVAAMRSHRARQAQERLASGGGWVESGMVFTTSIGTPLDPDNVRHYFSALTRSAGLGHWTPHEMRHSAASLLLAQGVPLEVVSELLGHSSIRMTKDVYGHLLRPQMRRAADAMDALLAPS